jgi:hypothetical protein
MSEVRKVLVDKFGREAADGVPRGAERTAEHHRSATRDRWARSHSGLAGVSTVGQGPRRTHAAGVGPWGGADRTHPGSSMRRS